MAEETFESLLTEDVLNNLRVRDGDFKYGPDASWGPSAKYTTDLGDELLNVSSWVRQKVVWTDDKKTRGKVEHWGLPIYQDGRWRGDCDDFTSAFRLVLTKLGWDEKVLRRTVCFYSSREQPEPTSGDHINHAVLGVTAFHGDQVRLLILDNRHNGVLPMSVLSNGREKYQNFAILSVFHNTFAGAWRRIEYSDI